MDEISIGSHKRLFIEGTRVLPQTCSVIQFGTGTFRTRSSFSPFTDGHPSSEGSSSRSEFTRVGNLIGRT